MSQNICVRFSDEEVELLDKLAKYLHARGMIKNDTKSDVIRMAVDILNRLVLDDIEKRRMGMSYE